MIKPSPTIDYRELGAGCARAVESHSDGRRFDLIRRTVVPMSGGIDSLALERIPIVAVRCQPGGCLKTATECFSCARFRSYIADTNTGTMAVFCRWRHNDLARDVMTLAHAMMVVSAREPAMVAHWRALDADVERVLVVDSNRQVVGTATADQLAAPYDSGVDTVAHRMTSEPRSIGLTATLGDAATAMAECEVDCLLIVGGGTVWGMITAEQLIDVAIDDEYAPAADAPADETPRD